MTSGHPDLTALIAGIIDWTANATLLPPREYGVIPVTAPASGVERMLTQPDALGLVMDVIQSVLFALPGEKSEDEAIENAVKAVLPDFEQKMEDQPGSVSLAEILDAVHRNLEQQEAAAPGRARAARRRADTRSSQDFIDGGRRDCEAELGQLAVDVAIAHNGFSSAMRTARRAMLGTVGGRPGLRRLLVSYFLAANLRCQASRVAGVTGKMPAQCLWVSATPAQRTIPGRQARIVSARRAGVARCSRAGVLAAQRPWPGPRGMSGWRG